MTSRRTGLPRTPPRSAARPAKSCAAMPARISSKAGARPDGRPDAGSCDAAGARRDGDRAAAGSAGLRADHAAAAGDPRAAGRMPERCPRAARSPSPAPTPSAMRRALVTSARGICPASPSAKRPPHGAMRRLLDRDRRRWRCRSAWPESIIAGARPDRVPIFADGCGGRSSRNGWPTPASRSIAVETYDTVSDQPVRPRRYRRASAAAPIDYALLYSANAAEALVETMRAAGPGRTVRRHDFRLHFAAASRSVLAGTAAGQNSRRRGTKRNSAAFPARANADDAS